MSDLPMTEGERIGGLGADIHAAMHDSICGMDPASCLSPDFWIATAQRVAKRQAEAASSSTPSLDEAVLAELRALSEAATPGPWRTVPPVEPNDSASVALVGEVEVRSVADGATPADDMADAAFIVAAVNAIRRLSKSAAEETRES